VQASGGALTSSGDLATIPHGSLTGKEYEALRFGLGLPRAIKNADDLAAVNEAAKVATADTAVAIAAAATKGGFVTSALHVWKKVRELGAGTAAQYQMRARGAPALFQKLQHVWEGPASALQAVVPAVPSAGGGGGGSSGPVAGVGGSGLSGRAAGGSVGDGTPRSKKRARVAKSQAAVRDLAAVAGTGRRVFVRSDAQKEGRKKAREEKKRKASNAARIAKARGKKSKGKK
jgi:hypothetical protein